MTLRTQVRLGKDDRELMTKHHNDSYWQHTPIEAFMPVHSPSFLSIPPAYTPEGRNSKQGASSPIVSDSSKHNKGSSSPATNS